MCIWQSQEIMQIRKCKKKIKHNSLLFIEIMIKSKHQSYHQFEKDQKLITKAMWQMHGMYAQMKSANIQFQGLVPH